MAIYHTWMVIQSGHPSSSTFHRLALAVGAVLWVLAPLALVGLLTMRAGSAQLAPEVTVWAPVEANTGDVGEPVDIVLEWQPAPPIVAPAWAGVVQSSDLRDGATIASGDVVAIVDGIARLAWATPQPFHRPLQLRDEGPDVAMLEAVLAARGLPVSGTTVFDRTTRDGVRALAQQLGVPGADRVEAFDPAWLVFLPADGAQVASASLTVGAPAPAPGTTIGELADRLAGAWLADPASPDDAPVRTTARAGQVLTVADTQLELTPELDAITADSLPHLVGAAAADATRVGARLLADASDGQWVVPSAAVFAVEDGRTCVLVGDRAGGRPVEVAVVGGNVGTAIVDAPLNERDRVAISPAAGTRRCD